jgi:predicted protein tyrosine phosphatase
MLPHLAAHHDGTERFIGVALHPGHHRIAPLRPFTGPAAPTIFGALQGKNMIHVCSLAALPATVKATGASHVLTVMANVAQVQRPESVLAANHLKVQMDDITEQVEGFVVPTETHVEQVLNFVRGWDRRAPLVIHCYAGISRSTASAFAAVCALNPHRDEIAIARQIRSASAIASPNRLIVSLADRALRREGRMLRALDEMGPGSMTIEGRPFRLDLE